MRMRWLGITGAILVGVALVLGAVGPRLWPTAYGSNQFGGMMRGGMMGGGMMGNMTGGDMMGGSMMNGEFADDASQPFDLRFLNQMIMHHQGAVMSAQMMIADSARPELRDLAQRIITNQQQQITQMRQWRQQWYATSGTGTVQEAMMTQMLQGNTMMSRDQMRQMMGTQASTDQMFLQMMIPHHQAAIAMAQQTLTQAEHAEIKTLAQNIITTQQAEIEEMRGYLRAWYGDNSGATR